MKTPNLTIEIKEFDSASSMAIYKIPAATQIRCATEFGGQPTETAYMYKTGDKEAFLNCMGAMFDSFHELVKAKVKEAA